MQEETQKASATSSPDPLTLDGPGNRQIDVFHVFPNWEKRSNLHVLYELIACQEPDQEPDISWVKKEGP
jgi:hypothetical protein